MGSPDTYTGKKVIVVDQVSHFPAYAPAEAIKNAGADVSIYTPKLFVGSLLDQATMVRSLRRLASKGIEMIANTSVEHISEGFLHVRNTLTGNTSLEKADVVIAAIGNQTVDILAQELSQIAGKLNVHVIGDASAPRTILEAIREGHELSRRI